MIDNGRYCDVCDDYNFQRATFILRLPDFERDVDAEKHIWAIDNHQLLVKYVWHLSDDSGSYYKKTNRVRSLFCAREMRNNKKR